MFEDIYIYIWRRFTYVLTLDTFIRSSYFISLEERHKQLLLFSCNEELICSYVHTIMMLYNLKYTCTVKWMWIN